jgi:diguanylate cyclase (GGDEF)-like protein
MPQQSFDLEQVLEHLPDGFVCVDRAGVVTFINQVACDMLQISPEQVSNRKKLSEVLRVDDKPYDFANLEADGYQSKVFHISSGNNKSIEAQVVAIPFSVTKSNLALISFKELGEKEDLFKKYQEAVSLAFELQIKMKDKKIYESQLINSILQSIRLTKDPHTMIRQIASAIMKELNSEISLMLTLKKSGFTCDIVAPKEHRSKFVELLVARDILPESFGSRDSALEIIFKENLPEPLNRLWPTNLACRLDLYEGSEPIFLLIALKSNPSTDVIALISSIRDQTGLSISSSHFEKLSHIDELTNVYNRRYFIQQSKVFFQESTKLGSDCSIVIIDLDHFKKINDTEGHLFGDEVLRSIGQLIQQGTRMADIVARYGGEEFILFLPDTDSSDARVMSERIRQLISKQAIAYGQSSKFVTASVGIASRLQSGATDVERLIDFADQALYKSKEAGRNRVTVYSK